MFFRYFYKSKPEKTQSLTCYLYWIMLLANYFTENIHILTFIAFSKGEHSETKCYMCDDVMEPENCRTTGYCEIDEVMI